MLKAEILGGVWSNGAELKGDLVGKALSLNQAAIILVRYAGARHRVKMARGYMPFRRDAFD